MDDRITGCAAGATARAARGGAELRAGIVLGVGVWLAGLLAGCATAGVESQAGTMTAAPRPVRLTIINEATRAWHLSFLDLDGLEVQHVRLRAREQATVELAAGEYTLEQALLSSSGTRESVRRFPLRLKPGGSYNWTLATLLSDAASLRGGRLAARD